MPEITKPKVKTVPFGTEQLEWVGHISSHWAGLEFLVDCTVWDLAKLPEQVGACITANFLSIYPKLKALAALSHLSGASDRTIKKLNRFRSELYQVSEKRNRAVHDYWIMQETRDGFQPVQLTITADGKPEFFFKPVSVKELKATGLEIDEKTKEFRKIREALENEISSLPKRTHKRPSESPQD